MYIYIYGPPSGANIGRLSGVDALWDCAPRVCGGGGGCAGGGVPLGAVPVLSWCGEVSLGGRVYNHHRESDNGGAPWPLRATRRPCPSIYK